MLENRKDPELRGTPSHFELVQRFVVGQTVQRLSIQLQDLITCTDTETDSLRVQKALHHLLCDRSD